jgi:hypothetical protein
MSSSSVYQENGFENRKDYLDHLAEEYEIEKEDVYQVAGMLGKNEDFDGLVTTLQDYSENI